MVQTAPGEFTWTAPTGRVHVVRPEPYDPLPDPVPPGDGAHASVPVEALVPPPRPGPPGRPRRNRHGHVTDAARNTARRLHQRAQQAHGAHDTEEPPF